MKNRSLVLKTAAVTFSLTLLATYVVARATGLIGKTAQPVTPVSSAPTLPAAQPAPALSKPPVDHFVGSKSAGVFSPDLIEKMKQKSPAPGENLIPAQTVAPK